MPGMASVNVYRNALKNIGCPVHGMASVNVSIEMH